MNIINCLADIEIAKKALRESGLNRIINGKELLCEIYCVPSHQHQAFYLQLYGGERFTILYAKTYQADFCGFKSVMGSFGDTVKENHHPAKEGSVYCGIKHFSKTNRVISKLLECLPKEEEKVKNSAVIIDGTSTLIRASGKILFYELAEHIVKNHYTNEQKAFLDNLYLHIEQLIGNLLLDFQNSSQNGWLQNALYKDKLYNDFWG